MSKLKSPDGLFAGRHFDRDVIILCVRWWRCQLAASETAR